MQAHAETVDHRALVDYSLLFLLGTIIVLHMVGADDWVTGSSSSPTDTGSPDPCKEAQGRIEYHRRNYERVLQNGATPEEIAMHGSTEAALHHYYGNGEQIRRFYERECVGPTGK